MFHSVCLEHSPLVFCLLSDFLSGQPSHTPRPRKGLCNQIGGSPEHLPHGPKDLDRRPCTHVRLRATKQVNTQAPLPTHQTCEGPGAFASVVPLSSALWAALSLSPVAPQGWASGSGTSFLLSLFQLQTIHCIKNRINNTLGIQTPTTKLQN